MWLFIEMPSSARAYVSGYADGLYQNPQQIPGAAPRIRHLMKNVPSVPRPMSLRCSFEQTVLIGNSLISSNASHLIRWSISRVLPFSYSATVNFPVPAIAALVKSMLGVTPQTTHCRNLRNKVFGCLVTDRSGFLGPRFDCVIRLWVVSAARSFHCLGVKSFTCVDHLLLDSLAAFFGLGSSDLTTGGCGVCFKNVSSDARSSFHPRCQEWSWTLSQRVSWELTASVPLARSATGNLRVFSPANKHSACPSEFHFGVICIMSSERANFSKLHQRRVVLLMTCLCVCCSSVPLDLETVEFPTTVTYYTAHQAMICSHVIFVLFHQLWSRPSLLVHLGQDSFDPRGLALSVSTVVLHRLASTRNFHRRRFQVTLQLSLDLTKGVAVVQHHLNHILVSSSLAPCHQAPAGFVHRLRHDRDHHFSLVISPRRSVANV